MKNYLEVGEYGVYDCTVYCCVEDLDGKGCDKCDLSKSKMKITDGAGFTICDVVRCGKDNRPDKKSVYFVKKWVRKKEYGSHSKRRLIQ